MQVSVNIPGTPFADNVSVYRDVGARHRIRDTEGLFRAIVGGIKGTGYYAAYIPPDIRNKPEVFGYVIVNGTSRMLRDGYLSVRDPLGTYRKSGNLLIEVVEGTGPLHHTQPPGVSRVEPGQEDTKMMRRPAAIVIVGVPFICGERHEDTIGDLLKTIPRLRLLRPVELLANHIDPCKRQYGVFATGVISGGLSETIIRAFRGRFPDTTEGPFHVTTSDFADTDFYDESTEGYLISE